MFNGQENPSCELATLIPSLWAVTRTCLDLRRMFSWSSRVDRQELGEPFMSHSEFQTKYVTVLSNWCRQDLHFASRPCLVHRIFTNAILANVDTMSHSTKCPPFETHGRAFVFFVISVLVARPVCQAENMGPRFKWEKYQSIMYWGVTSLFFFPGGAATEAKIPESNAYDSKPSQPTK